MAARLILAIKDDREGQAKVRPRMAARLTSAIKDDRKGHRPLM